MSEWHSDHAFRYLDDEMGAEERERFEDALTKPGAATTHLENAKKLRSLCASSRSELLLTLPAERHAPTEPLPNRAPSVDRSLWSRLRLPAGAFAVAAMAAVAFLTVTNSESPQSVPADHPLPTTEQPSNDSRMLADGSRIRLSPGSRYTVHSNSKNKVSIELEFGEVEAHVAKRTAKREFTVYAGEVSVRVRGTVFRVSRDAAQEVVVSVSEGKVAVATPAGEYLLRPGTQSRYSPPLPPTAPTPEPGDAPERKPSMAGSPTAAAPATAGSSSSAPPSPWKTSKRAKKLPTAAPSDPQAKRPATRPLTKTSKAPTATQGAASKVTKATQPGGNEDALSRPLGTASPASQTKPGHSPALDTPPRHPPQVAVSSHNERSSAQWSVEAIEDPVKRRLATMVLAIRRGKLHQSLAELDLFLQQHAKHRNASDALYLKGYCLHKLGNTEAALAAWKAHEAMRGGSPWLRTVGDWTHPQAPSVGHLR